MPARRESRTSWWNCGWRRMPAARCGVSPERHPAMSGRGLFTRRRDVRYSTRAATRCRCRRLGWRRCGIRCFGSIQGIWGCGEGSLGAPDQLCFVCPVGGQKRLLDNPEKRCRQECRMATLWQGSYVRTWPTELIGFGDHDPGSVTVEAETLFCQQRYLDTICGVVRWNVGDRKNDDAAAAGNQHNGAWTIFSSLLKSRGVFACPEIPVSDDEARAWLRESHARNPPFRGQTHAIRARVQQPRWQRHPRR